MAIVTKKVSELPVANDPSRFDVFGQDRTTGQNAKSQMSLLKGDTGASPDITVRMTPVPYGTAPSVDRSGTNTAPVFNIKFPLAADGRTPVFRVSGGYMQYRYADTDPWTNLVAMSTLKGDKGDKMTFEDLTDEDIATLQKPAIDAANTANTAAGNANDAASAAETATTQANDARDAANTAAETANTAAQAANTAAANVKDGKTPVFDGSSASVLDPSQPPAVSIRQTGTDEDGNPIYSLVLGIPRGQQGIQGAPPILVNGTVSTGAPGSDAVFTFTYSGVDEITGSPRYRIDGSIPQGAPGAGNGNVEVDASTLEEGKQYVFVPNAAGSPIGTFVEFVPPDNQVQADYGQTDPTAKDYIKNKPALSAVAASGAYNDLSGKPNLAPSFVTGNSYAATETGVAQTQQVRSIENGVGAPVVVQLPVATDRSAGVMPASAFAQVQLNTLAIQAIAQGGGKEWPSVATKADLDAFRMPASAAQNDVIKVRDDETQDGATTQYVATDTGGGLEWVFNLIVNFDPVGLATTTTPGLKKSSTIDGQTFTEADGTDSVNGWDALKQRVTNTETGLIGKPNPGNALPKQDGNTASAGVSIEASRADHVHQTVLTDVEPYDETTIDTKRSGVVGVFQGKAGVPEGVTYGNLLACGSGGYLCSQQIISLNENSIADVYARVGIYNYWPYQWTRLARADELNTKQDTLTDVTDIQLVSALPANPADRVLYLIPE